MHTRDAHKARCCCAHDPQRLRVVARLLPSSSTLGQSLFPATHPSLPTHLPSPSIYAHALAGTFQPDEANPNRITVCSLGGIESGDSSASRCFSMTLDANRSNPARIPEDPLPESQPLERLRGRDSADFARLDGVVRRSAFSPRPHIAFFARFFRRRFSPGSREGKSIRFGEYPPPPSRGPDSLHSL